MQASKVEWFESWFDSPYYHLLYQNRDEAEAEAFLNRLIAYLNPKPGSMMLDIACGEGRFSINLAARGFDVVGIDLSPASIAKAKAHEHDSLRFMVHDMRFPFYINYFDYSFNFFTSFGYFPTNRDHLMAAKAFAQGLKPGGTLVIDYLNRDYTIARLVPEDTITRGDTTFVIHRRSEGSHIYKNIQFNDASGRLLAFTERVAAFTRSEFVDLFASAGLTLTDTFGDYLLRPYDPAESPRMIMMFKK